MKILHGTPASPGYGIGAVYRYESLSLEHAPAYDVQQKDVELEQGRFLQAMTQAVTELVAVKKQVHSGIGATESAIFDAHISLLEDDELRDRILQRMQEELINAEQAVAREVRHIAEIMSALSNPFLRERSQDFYDIGNRILRNLGKVQGSSLSRLPPKTVIVAGGLTPSDTIALNPENVIGIVTETGGNTSHAAILSRSLGIPAVTGVPALLEQVKNGMQVLVDGERGQVVFEPTERQHRQFKNRKEFYEAALLRAQGSTQRDCRTADGTRISLYANINRASDLDFVTEHQLDGVGLYRTEFLFVRSSRSPRLSVQAKYYLHAAKTVAPKMFTIRTFDFSGDKQPTFLQNHPDAASLLQLRGLRFSLVERKLLRTQLRAIMRAHKECGNIRILFPMVMGRDQLKTALKLVHKAAEQEHITDMPPVGAMLETPSAIFELQGLIDLVDFISIGTNDLVQYTLFADRISQEAAPVKKSILTPAMLTALNMVITICRERNCPVSICGEAGGDMSLVGLFVGMGYREFSMSPVRAPGVQMALEKVHVKEMETLAQQVLQVRENKELGRLMQQNTPQGITEL